MGLFERAVAAIREAAVVTKGLASDHATHLNWTCIIVALIGLAGQVIQGCNTRTKQDAIKAFLYRDRGTNYVQRALGPQ